MTDERRFYQLLGLANRARKIVSGEELVLNEIKKGYAKLVVLSNDASNTTKKKIQNKCQHYQVKLIQVGDRVTLGHSIGKEQRVVLAVTDEGFAKKLITLLGQ